MEKDKKDEFVSSHDGHVLKQGGSGIRNSYEIWKDSEGKKFVKMKVLKNKEEFFTLFDYDDLSKVKSRLTWYILKEGYVGTFKNFTYLHHLVMNFKGTGRGFQQVSVDHINRNKLDNRKANLRLATAREQQENSKGRIEGTKRERQEIGRAHV